MIKKISLALLVSLLLISFYGCDGQDSPTIDNNSESQTDKVSKDLSYGDTFVFDNLEITFGNGIEWYTLENQYSDHNGKDVFSVPVTIKNVSNETHGLNIFYYTKYGSKGTELDDITAYFSGDVEDAGNFRSGATLESKMHFLYDGDGDYWVEFSIITFGNDEKHEVKLPIKKDGSIIAETSAEPQIEETTDEVTEASIVESVNIKQEYTFGDTITFDDLEVTFKDPVQWVVLNNKYSTAFGKSVAKVPLTIKNIGDETNGLNFLYYSKYGSKGTTLDDLSTYFDDDVFSSGDMRPNASIDTYMYFLYDGNGDYYVAFDNLTTQTEVKLPLVKPQTQIKLSTQSYGSIKFSYPETCTYAPYEDTGFEIYIESGNETTGYISLTGINDEITFDTATKMFTQYFQQMYDSCEVILDRSTTFLNYQAENLRVYVTKDFEDTLIDYYFININNHTMLIGYQSDPSYNNENIKTFNVFLDSLTFE